MNCTPSRHVRVKPDSEGKRTISQRKGKINEDFDPLTLPDEEIDFWKIKPAEKKLNNNLEINKLKSSNYSSQKHPIESTESTNLTESIRSDTLQPGGEQPEMVWGWRVQICALSDEVAARAVFIDAHLKFDEQIYLTYDSPYYKVRIGDCLSRYEADDLQKIAVERGFDDAWVVRTKVYKLDETRQEEATRE